jgi:hypothetical protein
MLRYLAAAFLCLLVFSATGDDDVFHFAPPDGTRFVRTVTRTARMEIRGMMRIEQTVFRARFAFRQTPSGFTLTMTPLSFKYLVNDQEVASPVWDLIREHPLRIRFNVVGKVTTVEGYDDVDAQLEKKSVDSPVTDVAFHLDRLPLAYDEREAWEYRLLLWLDQQSKPGTKLEYDSSERGFTGERVKSHTTMSVARTNRCGARHCVETHYTMIPNLDDLRRKFNDHANNDILDASASEYLEQVLETATMLPHFESLTWKSNFSSVTEDGTVVQHASLSSVSEFVYEAGGRAGIRRPRRPTECTGAGGARPVHAIPLSVAVWRRCQRAAGPWQ